MYQNVNTHKLTYYWRSLQKNFTVCLPLEEIPCSQQAIFVTPMFDVTEEIEIREKALVEELELIEVQVGLGKHQQNFDGSASLAATTEVQQSTEEGEENRDPNPDNNLEVETNEVVDVSVKSEKDESCDNSNEIEKKEEVQVDEVIDENNG